SRIGVTPRGFADHRRKEARRYLAIIDAYQQEYGPLPPIAVPTLREAGRAAVELERLGLDLETARARKQRREATRIRKQQFTLREQLARMENRLKDWAPPKSQRPMDAFARQPEAR